MVKHLPAMRETQVQPLGWEDALEKEMETHSSTVAWKIPWMEEAGRLQSMGHKESNTADQLHFHFYFSSQARSTLNFKKIQFELSFCHCSRSSFIQFSSVAQSCPTLCDPMNLSTPGPPVHHQLPEFTQIHVH